MDRRRQSRVFVDLPVQIWGMDAHSRPFTQPASLRTISGRGATLQCVDAHRVVRQAWNRNGRRSWSGESFRRHQSLGCRSAALCGGGGAELDSNGRRSGSRT